MDKEVLENHKSYLERVSFYRSFGYDLEKDREFIIDKAGPISGKILEIGTGKGHFALILAKRGFSFISIDLDKEEQKIALLNLQYFALEKQVKLLIDDAQNLSFSNKSFDVIFSVNLFHHLKEPYSCLKEMIRVLKPDGKIILSDFTLKGLEIINRCHTQEGKKHDYFKNFLDEAKDYFISQNFIMKEFHNPVQQVIVAGYK